MAKQKLVSPEIYSEKILVTACLEIVLSTIVSFSAAEVFTEGQKKLLANEVYQN